VIADLDTLLIALYVELTGRIIPSLGFARSGPGQRPEVFCALAGGEPPEFHPGHPLGCHRRRVPGRVVFEHVVAALVHGSGYERIATPGCSDRTIRRRLAEWTEMGIAEALHAAALRAYDQIIGLELGDVAVDGCLTKAPCGGERAGPSPVDRRKGGLKRSVASDGYDSTVTRQLLDELGFDGEIARRGIPAPIQAGTRWVVERTHSWMNGYGKLRRCTERNAKIVDFYLYLAAALVTIRQLIQRARKRYRWDSRPTTKRLKLRLLPGALS
jgi:hypothetical protein